MIIAFVMTYILGISAITVILLCIGVGVTNLIIDIKRNKEQDSIQIRE